MELIEGFSMPFLWFYGIFSPVVLKTIGITAGFLALVTLLFFCGCIIFALGIKIFSDKY